jgi:hypothetical protein
LPIYIKIPGVSKPLPEELSMDGVAGTAANGIEDVNRILQLASAENIDLAKKLMKVTVETALQGSEAGKGGAVDVSA